MTDYHDATTTYAYYSNNRLSTLTAPGSKTWTYSNNRLGQPTQVVLPNGMATVYGYDGRNRLTRLYGFRGVWYGAVRTCEVRP